MAWWLFTNKKETLCSFTLNLFVCLKSIYLLNPGGGGATQVWFGWGRASETWKVDPFLYQILPKNETHFLYQSHKFYAKITKNFTLFSKIVKLSSKF